MSEWRKLREELLADPETRAEYERLGPRYELASKLIELRRKLNMSQRDLARAAGVTQPEISRIERGQVSPTWETISKILHGVGEEVQIVIRVKDGKPIRV